MNSITEAEFADFMRNGAIKRLYLNQSEEGRFGIQAELTWKEGLYTLMTTRGTPREWASLDRLTRHIAEKHDGQVEKVPICLTLASKPT